MKKIMIRIGILLSMIPIGSCQTKEKKMIEKFDWEEKKSAPLGYPIEVYRGGFSSKDGGYMSLYGGITTAKSNWGVHGGGMGSGLRSLPDHIHVQWLSYAEDAIFEVDVDIDREKIAAYFREGYDSKVSNGTGEIRHRNYDGIVAGFAPGGVVVIWVKGIGIQKEIGRYQGKQIEIPQAEIDALEPPDHMLFDLAYRKKLFTQNNVVPLAVQEANKNKPIPFGLWDEYRIKYTWKPVFDLGEGAVLDQKSRVIMEYVNGEVEPIFNEKFPLESYSENAIPFAFAFSWLTKEGVRYAGNCELDDDSAFDAFKQVFGDNPEQGIAELVIRPNISNTYFTVQLKGNNKEVFIKAKKLEVFKPRKQD